MTETAAKGFAKEGIFDQDSYGPGLVYINMALLGIVFTTYILIVGGELNGPTIGGIFTVVGFCASGKHLKNVLPILLGVF